jgi:hypothetical protein
LGSHAIRLTQGAFWARAQQRESLPLPSFPTRPISRPISFNAVHKIAPIVLKVVNEHHHLWWECRACWGILVSANAPLWRKVRRPHRCGARGPLRGHPTWSRKSPWAHRAVAEEWKQFATLSQWFHVFLTLHVVSLIGFSPTAPCGRWRENGSCNQACPRQAAF